MLYARRRVISPRRTSRNSTPSAATPNHPLNCVAFPSTPSVTSPADTSVRKIAIRVSTSLCVVLRLREEAPVLGREHLRAQ